VKAIGRAWILGLVLAFGLTGCLRVQLFGGLPDPLEEQVLDGDAGPKILLLEIDGVISREPAGGVLRVSDENPVSRIREELDKARADPQVKALLLRVDSPGGTATASDVVYREVLRFKRERGVPVVAYLLGTAASGGYYVAMAADHIVAHPASISGSIGVLFMGVNVAGLMEKLGIEDQTIVAGAQKDAGSPLRRMRPAERRHFQTIVDELHAFFQSVVVEGRPELDADRVAKLSDGRVFSARQALDAGLVDEIGGTEQALAVVKRLAGVNEVRLVSYSRPDEYENNIYTEARVPQQIRIALPEPFDVLSRPGFYFLWAPGLGTLP